MLRNLDFCIGRLAVSTKPWNNTLGQIAQARTGAKYAAAAILPLPNNIDAAETTRFSPQRNRDISANVMSASTYNSHTPMSAFPSPALDITVDNSTIADNNNTFGNSHDPHIQSYDQCYGAVSLNSALQSNVPTPFGGMHKFSHLNMPGGQWSQEGKFMAQQLHSSHYTALRQSTRFEWAGGYDQDATVDGAARPTAGGADGNDNYRSANATTLTSTNRHAASLLFCPNAKNSKRPASVGQAAAYSTKAQPKEESKPAPASEPAAAAAVAPLTKKEKLKRAFADYGATVVVFHVTISLASLGCCYLLVSGGIDMLAVLDYLGLSSSALSSKVATGASTFVVAYAIHKVFAPVRISITLGATPFIVRYLRAKGILKLKTPAK